VPLEIVPTLTQLEKAADANRPEIAAAEHSLRRSGAQLDAAEQTARWPSFRTPTAPWSRSTCPG
jgi:outer membrane protein TolC